MSELFETGGDNNGQQFGIGIGPITGDNNRVNASITQNNTSYWTNTETHNTDNSQHTHYETHNTSHDSHETHNTLFTSNSYDDHSQTWNNYTSYDDHSYTDNSTHISASFTSAKQVAMFGLFFSEAKEIALVAVFAIALFGVAFWAYVVMVAEAVGVLSALVLAVRMCMLYAEQTAEEKALVERQAAYRVALAEQREHELRFAEASRPMNITINVSDAKQLAADPYAYVQNMLSAQPVQVVKPKQITTQAVDAGEEIVMPVRRQKVLVKR